MSIELNSVEHELTVEEILHLILLELKLLNLRYEEATNTNINEADV